MARVKSEKVIVTFPTTTQAMKMEKAARACGAPGRLIPVPREISAGCGMAWRDVYKRQDVRPEVLAAILTVLSEDAGTTPYGLNIVDIKKIK